MEYKNIKIKGKILFPLFVVIGLLVLVSIREVHRAENNNLRQMVGCDVSRIRMLMSEYCSDDANTMKGLIDFISRNEKLRSAWMRQDKTALLYEAAPIFTRIRREFKITHFYFTNKDRTSFLRVHNPLRNGDIINRGTTLQASKSKKDAYGLELGKFGTFTLRYVHPWVIDGEIVGYIELGKELSVITKRLTRLHSARVVLTIQKKFLNQLDWEEGQDMLGLDGLWKTLNNSVITCNTFGVIPTPLREFLNSVDTNNLKRSPDMSFDGKTYSVVTDTLYDYGRRPVGKMSVIVNVSEPIARMRKLDYSIILAGIIGLSILYLFFYFYLNTIEKKLNKEEKGLVEALKKAESSEHRVTMIFESLQAGIIMIDYDTHEILEVNQYAADLIGLEQNGITGRNCHNFICPAEEGACPVSDMGMVVDQSERVLVTAGGRKIPILKSVGALELQGRHVLLENFIDISKIKEVEEQLRIASDSWQRTFDAMDEMISIIDNDFKIIDSNKAMKEAFGNDLTGLLCYELVHGLSAPPDVCPTRKMLASGEPMRTEFFEEKLNMWLDVGVFPVKNDAGKIIKFIHSVRNITDRKNAENQLKKATEDAEAALKAKSEFLASMSHEIRTPMNGVVGMSDLLMGTELTDEQLDYAETIRVSGESLLCIINDILDFSKIESGNLELENRVFELAPCVEGVLEILAEPAKTKDIELNYLINDGVPEFISGDSTRLWQILINLANNALKFTESGEVFIAIEKIWEDEKSVELSFSVKDTGIGIPKNKLDVLFSAFTQVDSSTTRKYGGTGLGLAISKRLSELMGGGISVTSKEGQGSTFTFTIKPDRVLNPPKKRNTNSTNILKNMRVLIVDDNETNRKILSILCEKCGMIPVVVNGGVDALKELAGKRKFQLVLLDMHMPEMDGFTLSRTIREKFAKKDLPIIMLSSHGPFAEIASIKNVVNDYLAKPIKQSLLLDTILQLFDKNGTSRQEFIDTGMDYSLNDTLGDTNPMRILLAEDNKVNQKVMLKTLQKMGYSADVVDNGVKAVESMMKNKYDLVFMDVHMPEMDGLEATREIVSKIDKDERPLIIAMTANAMDGDKEMCLEAGMDDYISKPISVKEVQNKLERWSSSRCGKKP